MEKQGQARGQNNPGGAKTRRQKNPISTVLMLLVFLYDILIQLLLKINEKLSFTTKFSQFFDFDHWLKMTHIQPQINPAFSQFMNRMPVVEAI